MNWFLTVNPRFIGVLRRVRRLKLPFLDNVYYSPFYSSPYPKALYLSSFCFVFLEARSVPAFIRLRADVLVTRFTGLNPGDPAGILGKTLACVVVVTVQVKESAIHRLIFVEAFLKPVIGNP